ncbi:hypothetical protein DPMN_125506 [Dreissena polymorpha]|uniref:Uncharacterized protein n=1 Tax=Dreissena polymorpha TaxID=45954 RepID=A0A9D4GVJ3_DREPO|nr:hypothetical protein DPMN_125506 [Dreissena polymorpha]
MPPNVVNTGPENTTKIDEDSGDEDLGGKINNLTGNQLAADVTVSVRSATRSVSNITDTNHSDTSQDEVLHKEAHMIFFSRGVLTGDPVHLPYPLNSNGVFTGDPVNPPFKLNPNGCLTGDPR